MDRISIHLPVPASTSISLNGRDRDDDTATSAKVFAYVISANCDGHLFCIVPAVSTALVRLLSVKTELKKSSWE